MSWDGFERREGTEDMLVLKKIVIGVAVTTVVQLFGAIWWAATVTAKLEFVGGEVTALKSEIKYTANDRYRSTDAAKDFINVNAKIDRNTKEIDDLKKSFERYLRGYTTTQ